jgi:hypothetical protein
MQRGEVEALDLSIGAGGDRANLPQDSAQQGTALLGNFPEPVFVRGGVDRWGEADLAHDVFAVREAADAGAERRERAHARVHQQQLPSILRVASCPLALSWSGNPSVAMRSNSAGPQGWTGGRPGR